MVSSLGYGLLRPDEPVIVLTCARSGSTLLRFILDAHPVLGCPPETGVIEVIGRMGNVSMLVDGPRDGAQGRLSDLALSSIRSWVITTFGTYLVRAGKARWCDKSLGSAASAGRFLTLFPKTRFICLYRNCMDVIDSLHEACPWGLRGYGLEPFVASHPGNTVAAAADYWVTHTRMITQFEQVNPDACLRVRYEELVANPEAQAARIFAFLGEEPVPAIASACFAGQREQFGAADHKIWETSSVHADSVGRGVRVPTAAIPAPVITSIKQLQDQLGYTPLDDGWNASPAAAALAGWPVLPDPAPSGGPPDEAREPAAEAADAAAVTVLDELESVLVPRLSERLPEASAPPGPGTAARMSFRIAAAARSQGAVLMRYWQVDLDEASISRVTAASPVTGGDGDAGWGVAGDASAWVSVLGGRISLATALRHGRLRLSEPQAAPENDGMSLPQPPLADPRIPILTRLIAPARIAPGPTS